MHVGLFWGYTLSAPVNILWVISFDVGEKKPSHWKGWCEAESLMGGKRHFNHE